jgi:hypothetical protein
LLPEEMKIKIQETIFSGSILWLVCHIKRPTLAVSAKKAIYNPEKNEVIGDYRTLHNEKTRNSYLSNISNLID